MSTTACRLTSLCLGLFILPALAADSSLIVVQDLGGASALPYYQALHLQRGVQTQANNNAPSLPAIPKKRFSEADLLPVRSARLTPGAVAPRTINVPGLTPIFLIGDDHKSRAWLRAHLEKLRTIRAVGFVVRVDSQATLDSLRRLAPGLTLSPSSGDDFAQRLNIQHYPVLITATAIEQ